MNPFLLSRSQRTAEWKNLRAEIAAQPSVDAKIDLCLAFWRQAGFENRVLDWDNCSTWPNPWELIYSNRYCTSSHSLGIAYTLMLADPITFEDLQLRLINDRDHSIEKIVCDTHGYLLNHGFVDRVARNSLKAIYTQARWHWIDKKWQQV